MLLLASGASLTASTYQSKKCYHVSSGLVTGSATHAGQVLSKYLAKGEYPSLRGGGSGCGAGDSSHVTEIHAENSQNLPRLRQLKMT